MSKCRLRLEGVSEVEVMELEEILGPSIVKVTRPAPGGGDRHGDFGLGAALIELGSVALSGLAVWLAKKNVKNIHESGVHIVQEADGTLTIDVRSIRTSVSSAPPDVATTKSLFAGLQNLVASFGDGSLLE
jgi:hypothetical protein